MTVAPRVLAIAGAFLRRQLRSPVRVMMLAVIPLVVAFIFGLADKRASDALSVGVVRLGNGDLGDHFVTALEDDPALRIVRYASRDGLMTAVARGDVVVGVVVPSSYDARLTSSGRTAVDVAGERSEPGATAARAAIASTVTWQETLLDVARRHAGETGERLSSALNRVQAVGSSQVTVERPIAHERARASGLGRSTAGMLVFFVFTNAMYAAFVLVDDRERGVVERIGSTPTPMAAAAGGEILGRMLLLVLQAVLIVAGGWLLFDIRWGDPVAAGLVILLYSTVATSAAVLIGALAARGSSAQVNAATTPLSAVLGLLGGCFWSLAVVPDWLRMLGHVAPQAWAVDGFETLVTTDGGVGAIAVPLAVLLAFAVALFSLAAVQFRTILRH